MRRVASSVVWFAALLAVCTSWESSGRGAGVDGRGGVAEPPARATRGVESIDLYRVFETDFSYKQTMAVLQGELQEAERELNAMRTEGQKLFERLEKTTKGTPEYRSLQTEIARREAEFQLEVNIQKRNFAEREARAMFDAWQAVQGALDCYASGHALRLIVQHFPPKLDPHELSTIQRAYAQVVVFQRGTDLTDEISTLVNAQPDASESEPPTVQGEIAKAAVTVEGIACIDMVKLFENYSKYKQVMELIQRDQQAAENKLNVMRAEGQALFEKLEKLGNGTPEYKSLDEEIARREAEFKLEVNIQKRNFAEREAFAMCDAMEDALRMLRQYADGHKTGLVLQYSAQAVQPFDAESLTRALAQTVVYQRGLDITDEIIAALNADPNLPKTEGKSRTDVGRVQAPADEVEVGCIDLTGLLESGEKYQQALAAIGREKEQAAGELNATKAAAVEKSKALAKLLKSTPEYRVLDRELEKLQAVIKVEETAQEKDFAEREVRAKIDAWNDLRQTLRQYAEDRGLRLIVQYSSAPVSVDDPQSLQRAYGQPVVYQRGLDITAEISKLVKAAPQAAQAKPPAARQ